VGNVAEIITFNVIALLLGILREPEEDYFPNAHEKDEYRAQKEKTLEQVLSESEEILKSSGLDEDQHSTPHVFSTDMWRIKSSKNRNTDDTIPLLSQAQGCRNTRNSCSGTWR